MIAPAFHLVMTIFHIDHTLLTRVPEIVFKGSEVWVQMEDEELLDVKDLLTWFVISSLIERVFHAFLEVGDWTC